MSLRLARSPDAPKMTIAHGVAILHPDARVRLGGGQVNASWDGRGPGPIAGAYEDAAGFWLDVEGLVGSEAREVAGDVFPREAGVVAHEEEGGAVGVEAEDDAIGAIGIDG